MNYFKKLLLTLLICFVPTSAMAVNACFDRNKLKEHLTNKFQEYPKGAGLAANGQVLELWSSKDGETWTITLTTTNGQTCVMASGESFNIVQPKIEPKGTKS